MEQRDGSQCVPSAGSDVADVSPGGACAISSRYLQLSCSHSCSAGSQREKPMDWALPKVVLGCSDCAELFF